jgi:carboxypeptidase Taq
LREWLRENIHRQGRRKTAREFLRDLTNAEPQPEPFLQYLEEKYSRLYSL